MRDHKSEPSAVRADKWLWAARFYKTRSLAMQAITGGKVHLNGTRIKPARKLVIGDTLAIRKGCYTFTVTIEGLSLQRGPAEVARSLYTESGDSVLQRQQLREEQAMQGRPARHERRPDKRARRQIHRFKMEQGE